jgi:hypothetical protein
MRRGKWTFRFLDSFLIPCQVTTYGVDVFISERKPGRHLSRDLIETRFALK